MTPTDQASSSTTPASQAMVSDRLPSGFRYAGVACGIKASGKSDLSLIVCDDPVRAAGVYTRNQVVAAPVVLCRQRTPSESIRAVVANSGNANACTGDVGMRDAKQMSQLVADRIGCQPQDVLVMSTGIIGVELPMKCIEAGITAASAALGSGLDDFENCADAILTTDQDRKTVHRVITCNGQQYSLVAMAKGAGMIAPNMATMLAVVLTDAPIAPDSAQSVLKRAANISFNRVSVDGHTSTNDTLLLLSSGGGTPLDGPALEDFQSHLNEVSIELAKKLVADGEGASHVMSIRVTGAETEADAEIIAKTVAASPLVKTAITGGDPNWGRIVSAAGYAEAKIQPERVSLKICETEIYADGAPVPFDAASLSKNMKQSDEVSIKLKVGDGDGVADYWSSDLTTDYVTFNSEYTT